MTPAARSAGSGAARAASEASTAGGRVTPGWRTALMPLVIAAIARAAGWRSAFAAIGLLSVVVAGPVAALFGALGRYAAPAAPFAGASRMSAASQ